MCVIGWSLGSFGWQTSNRCLQRVGGHCLGREKKEEAKKGKKRPAREQQMAWGVCCSACCSARSRSIGAKKGHCRGGAISKLQMAATGKSGWQMLAAESRQ